jgi:hypothetical protein
MFTLWLAAQAGGCLAKCGKFARVVATKPVDFRKGAEGLAAIVR